MLCSFLFWESRNQFPCLTADPTVAWCVTDVQYNLYNASFIDFSNVVYDRLIAGVVNDVFTLISKLTGTVDPTEHERSGRSC